MNPVAPKRAAATGGDGRGPDDSNLRDRHNDQEGRIEGSLPFWSITICSLSIARLGSPSRYTELRSPVSASGNIRPIRLSFMQRVKGELAEKSRHSGDRFQGSAHHLATQHHRRRQRDEVHLATRASY